SSLDRPIETETPPASTLPTPDEVLADTPTTDRNPLGREASREAQAGRIETVEHNQIGPAQTGRVFETDGLDPKAKAIVDTVNTRTERRIATAYKSYIEQAQKRAAAAKTGRTVTGVEYYPAREEIDIAQEIARDADVIEARAGRVAPNVPPGVGPATDQGTAARRVLYHPWDETVADRSVLYRTGAVQKAGKGNARGKRAFVEMVDSHARFVPEDVARSADFRRAMDEADAIRPTLRNMGERARTEPYASRQATKTGQAVAITNNPRNTAAVLADDTRTTFDKWADSARRHRIADREARFGPGGAMGQTTDEAIGELDRGRVLAPSERTAMTDEANALPVDLDSVSFKGKADVDAWARGERKGVATETPLERWKRKADQYEQAGIEPKEADIRAAIDVQGDMTRWNRMRFGDMKGRPSYQQVNAIRRAADVATFVNGMAREAILTGPLSGARYVTNQQVGNTITMFITGNGNVVDLAKYTLNPVSLWKNFKDLGTNARVQRMAEDAAAE
ncbi:MAG: hypothetical protein WBA46_17800, partial [Thermomicrobiales bacterium]